MKTSICTHIAIAVLVITVSCGQPQDSDPYSTTTEVESSKHAHSPSHDHEHDHDHSTREAFSIANLAEEITTVPDSIIEYLHRQHHSHSVLERRTVPSGYETKNMKYWKDYIAQVEDLPVINPGPGEYVHVMEGYKHGYQNLVIGITETFPGGAPPMHTHEGEESHVLLEGTILYALGDTIFKVTAPYIINIPPMVPHAFKNIGDKTANLVVIFPTNVWKYDVLD